MCILSLILARVAKLSGHPRKILGSERAALEKNLEKVQFFIIRAKF